MKNKEIQAIFEKKINELICMYQYGKNAGDLHGCVRTACTIAEIIDLSSRLGLVLDNGDWRP